MRAFIDIKKIVVTFSHFTHATKPMTAFTPCIFMLQVKHLSVDIQPCPFSYSMFVRTAGKNKQVAVCFSACGILKITKEPKCH